MLAKLSFKKTVLAIAILAFVYFTWLMIKITAEYIPAKSDVSFLMIKQTEVHERPEYLYFFYAHVYSSIFVLIAGFFSVLRMNFGISNLHTLFGKTYCFLLLFISAPSGIYMGFFANGNIFAKLSFIILGIVWWISTYKAYVLVRKKEFKLHKQWMWRSFALAISALTLRLWKVILVYLFHPNPLDVYQIVAWLGWVPNLLLVEYLLLKRKL